jgi:hypothetical protein
VSFSAVVGHALVGRKRFSSPEVNILPAKNMSIKKEYGRIPTIKNSDPKGNPGTVDCDTSPKRGSIELDISDGEGWVSPFGDTLKWGRLGRRSPEGETKAGVVASQPFPTNYSVA